MQIFCHTLGKAKISFGPLVREMNNWMPQLNRSLDISYYTLSGSHLKKLFSQGGHLSEITFGSCHFIKIPVELVKTEHCKIKKIEFSNCHCPDKFESVHEPIILLLLEMISGSPLASSLKEFSCGQPMVKKKFMKFQIGQDEVRAAAERYGLQGITFVVKNFANASKDYSF